MTFSETFDTLSGIAWAEDPSGIDSLWLSVEGDSVARDGYFQRSASVSFAYDIVDIGGSGRPRYAAVRLSARDVQGYTSRLDTGVIVVP